jgi:DNA-binding beta-propeller fold protein YncE
LNRLLVVLTAALWLGTACLDEPGVPGPQPSAPPADSRNLFVYTIDDTGGIAPVAGSPFVSGTRFGDVESLSFSSTLGLVFVAGDITHTFAVLRQDTLTGRLTHVPGSPFWAQGINPSETVVNPPGTLDDRYLFVGNGTSETVSSFRLREDGVPFSVDGSLFPATREIIEGMTIDPGGRWLIVNGGPLSVLEVGLNGRLSPVAGSPFPGVFSADEVVVHPAGGLVFATNRAQASISVFVVGQDGALSPAPGSPVAAPTGFRAYEHDVLTSDGTRLFAGFEIPPAVVTYTVGLDGSLTLVPSTPVLLGTPGPGGPEGMVVDPTDRFLYVTDHITDRIHIFAIQSDGGLVPVVPGGVPVGAEPFDVIIPTWRVAGRPVLIVAARPR